MERVCGAAAPHLKSAPTSRRATFCLVPVIAALAALACGRSPDLGSTPTEQETVSALTDPAPATGLAAITQDSLRSRVEYLASPSLHGRAAGSGDDEIVAQYIDGELTRAALVPDEQETSRTQTFLCDAGRGFSYNVIARLPGTVYPDQIVIVGAHHDHLPPSLGVWFPGADDNASGSALLLEVAQALALQGPQARTVIFAAFGAEEYDLVGSTAWIQKRFTAQRRPTVMLNADMVGHVATGGLQARGLDPNGALAHAIEVIAKRNGLSSSAALVLTEDCGCGSDHMPFHDIGVPVAFFHTGLHADYHEPTDTPDTLDYGGLTNAARVVYELTWNLAHAKNLPALPVPLATGTEHRHLDHCRRPFTVPGRALGVQ